jgi:hypothetical protein
MQIENGFRKAPEFLGFVSWEGVPAFRLMAACPDKGYRGVLASRDAPPSVVRVGAVEVAELMRPHS